MSEAKAGKYALSTKQMLKAQWQIILALMLHDIRSRMGGSALGFVAMGVGFPLVNILVLLLINTGMRRVAPYGESPALWFASGVVPYMAFQYTSRWVMLGPYLDRPLLSFPVVKFTDVVIARALIELLNTGVVVLTVFAIFWAWDIDFMPRDPVQASLAMLAMTFLGLAWGILNSVIAAAFPIWVTGFLLSQILMWISSGILLVPDSLPRSIGYALSFLPWLQGVEWMRSAYYDGFGADILDRGYLVYFATGALFLGLLVERMIRGTLLR